ncbi:MULTISPECIES: hypothetical protein [Methylomonas]|uniref:Uncharacterized protein n=2 Tax=Methylomonas TaxID=416 RepID=A0A126T4D9_9GAMM|nr:MULTISPECIES: hypothetical protein [Methylomonas]AMK76959.1 hypothetical protein JT25_010745 [Methylomonas denitrificans]OAH97989.1 hypothetical protein A1342_19955 [Methylomonas methanica]TCV81138.1 hypothetical protein EDE11_11626 [Methylomonas methanica]
MNISVNNNEPHFPAYPQNHPTRNFKSTQLLIFAACLLSSVPGSSHADFVTHPLTEAPSSQSPEPATPAVPEAADTSQPNQAEIDFNEQFGEKKLGTCSMTYKLEGFSLAYKQYDGTGEITCRNGQKAKVALSSKSIGFTIGYSVIEGEAYFTDVKYISELFGDYVSLGNHFGFKNSVDRQVLTRGEISLVMLGKGKGFDIGFTIGDLSIKPR